MRDAIGSDGPFQGLGDVLLPCYFVETSRAPLSVKNLVGRHLKTGPKSIYRELIPEYSGENHLGLAEHYLLFFRFRMIVPEEVKYPMDSDHCELSFCRFPVSRRLAFDLRQRNYDVAESFGVHEIRIADFRKIRPLLIVSPDTRYTAPFLER